MTQNKKICSDCKFEPLFGFVDAAKEKLDTANQILPALIDGAIEVVDESKRLAPSPVIDQNNAKVLDITARTGGIVADATDNFDSIADVMSSPVCSDAERAASPTGCPKVDLILPHMTALIESVNKAPKGI